MKAWAGALLAGVLAACVAAGAREPLRYFVLDVPLPAAEARAPRALTLLVAPTSAVPFYDGQQIVYSREPGTRAYYQFNRWVERPSRRLHALLLERLRRAGAFEHVLEAASGTRAGLQLRVNLEELYHDASTAPGRVHVTVTAALTDAATGEPLAQRAFTRTAQASDYDAAGAVHGFNRAIGRLLDDLAAWIEDTAPR